MKRDSRLSLALHLLLHMDGVEAITSESLARSGQTHPVVMRRTMAGLREAGIVHSEKGHGGGWTLARPLEKVTLADVYAALGTPALFALSNRTESPGCLVEQVVNERLGAALSEAEQLLLRRFGELSLAEIGKEVQRRCPPQHRHKKRSA